MIMHPFGRAAALVFAMATVPALLLQGCIPLAITAAGGTALVVTDRRSTGCSTSEWSRRLDCPARTRTAAVSSTAS